MSNRVVVDQARCLAVAQLIDRWAVPVEQEDVSLPTLGHAELGNYLFLLVAICHQTSPYGRPSLEGSVAGVFLRGWDYLSARLAAAVLQEPTLLAPGSWKSLTAAEVRRLFRDEEKGERLTDPEGRAKLIRDLGKGMQRAGWTWVEDMHTHCDGRIAGGHPNLLGTLSRFRAYKDPVRKKAFYFLALMQGAHLWSYRDPEAIGPPVDYHECRGHLRLQTVVIKDKALKGKVGARSLVSSEDDVAIRAAVMEAIQVIARHTNSGLTPMRLHYLFWNVFRACCKREAPHCMSCDADCGLPERYVPLALHPGGRACPFMVICPSARAVDRPIEQVIDAEYY